MLEIVGSLFVEVFLHGLVHGTGHLLVYLFSLGRVKCSDELAAAFGIGFWLVAFLIAIVLIAQ